MTNRLLYVVATCFLGTTMSLAAQSAGEQPEPAFEVATIKRNAKEQGTSLLAFQPGGRFVMINYPLTFLIPQAYPAPSGGVVGAPPWLGTDNYDIIATAPGDPPREVMQKMIGSLLRERFNFKAHYEKKEAPAFALVVDRSDGRLGPQLRKTSIDCAARAAAARANTPLPPLSILPTGVAPCRTQATMSSIISGGITMEALARSLGTGAGAPVFDRTELQGYYEVSLRFAEDPNAVERVPGDTAPLLSTAIREQLGLRLRPERALVDVLIIDKIDRPTED